MQDYYKLEEDLGKGQYGVVKLATHINDGYKTAIKIIKKINMDATDIYQQRREIEILKMCQHPNIIGLIDLFENIDYYYIVLEYMQGKDLFHYLKVRDLVLPEKRVKEIMYQIMIAVKYLHDYGIVHRDLKLENIMMTDTSNSACPKITDFGLAKMLAPN